MTWSKKRKVKKIWKSKEISPEDIFIDALNLSELDEGRFEGRLEKPLSKLAGIALVLVFFIIAGTFVGRSFLLQIVEGSEFKKRSEENRLRYEILFANRGIIYDRNGEPLVWNESHGTSSLPFSRRVYTASEGFAHVLGYVDSPKKDASGIYYQEKYIGKEGVEGQFDIFLSGENGYRLIEENARQQELSRSSLIPPQNGDSLDLSIDKKVQEHLYRAIRDTSNEVGFTGGAGGLMNINTGEMIALTSFPEFDPQIMSSGEDAKAVAEFLTDDANPFLNRMISGLYTPGSTVKPYVAIGALEEKIISPEKQIESTGALVIPNPYYPNNPTIIRDWKVLGWLDMREAIAMSSNVYFMQIGGGFQGQKGIGIKNIEKYSRMFGLGERSGIDLGGEVEGVIPNPKWKESVFGEEWVLGDSYNTSIGQYGFQITPIQLLRAVSGIANGGNLIEPTILADKRATSKPIGVSKNTLLIIHDGMRGAVEYGTASAINVNYEDFAAKTGTAELGVSKSQVNSWISGFFPYEDPKYAFVVVMERGPRSNLIGASSVARRFFDSLYEEYPEFFSKSAK